MNNYTGMEKYTMKNYFFSLGIGLEGIYGMMLNASENLVIRELNVYLRVWVGL